MAIRRYCTYSLLTLLLVLLPDRAESQDDDFGLWYNVSTDHSLTSKIDLSLKASLRTYENASVINEAFIEGQFSYSFNDYLSAAASYRIAETREDNEEYYIRHKFFSSLKGELPVDRFSLSARAMLMVINRTYTEDEDDKSTFSTFRLKLKAEYNIKGLPLNPFLGFESFTRVTVDSENIIDKARFLSGVDYKISKNHSLELEYMLDRDETPDLYYVHLIAVSYNFKF